MSKITNGGLTYIWYFRFRILFVVQGISK